MQNKAKFQKVKMNVNKVLTNAYEKKTLGQRGKNKPNTNPIQSQSNPIKANKMPKQTQYKPKTNPISKAKLKPCKLQLIKRIWCYKATMVFTKNTVKRNCFFIKSLEPARKHCQSRDVDFLQHRALIHIRVAFRKVGTKLKAYVYGWPNGLFLG